MNKRNVRHGFEGSGISDDQIESRDCGGPFSLYNAIESFDPFQQARIPLDCVAGWIDSENGLGVSAEQEAEWARDRERELTENAYNDRARWGCD